MKKGESLDLSKEKREDLPFGNVAGQREQLDLSQKGNNPPYIEKIGEDGEAKRTQNQELIEGKTITKNNPDDHEKGRQQHHSTDDTISQPKVAHACSNRAPHQDDNHKTTSTRKPQQAKAKDHIKNGPKMYIEETKKTKQDQNCEHNIGNAKEAKRPAGTERRQPSPMQKLSLDPEKKFKQGTFSIQSSKDVQTQINSLLHLVHENMWMFLIGGVVVLAVFGCFNLFKKADFHPPDLPHYAIRAKRDSSRDLFKKADFHPPDLPHYAIRAKRDSSRDVFSSKVDDSHTPFFTDNGSREKRDLITGKGQITNPVLKKKDPLRISFPGSNTSCTVFIDNKSISSEVDQEGKYRVYQKGTFCFLDIHQFSLGNHSIDKPIQVDSSLIRIGNDNLMDLIKNGLVVYGTAVQNARVAEVSFSEVGKTANCFYGTMVNATVSKYKLILPDGKSINVIQKKIVYNRCSSFQINCTVGEQHFSLMIPQCLVDIADQTHQSAIIGVVCGAVFCIGLLVFLIYCYKKKCGIGFRTVRR